MINSGIPGLDEISGKGLSRHQCILLNGGPGSGKTTLAMQFLYKGALEYDEPGIFVSLCENPDDIRKNMSVFGWNVAKLERQNKLMIIDARPVTHTEDGYIVPNEGLFKGENIPFSHIANQILQAVNEMGAKRLAIDSITILTTQYENNLNVRQGLLGLIQVLSSLDCVTILLSESEEKDAYIERVLVPAVIMMYYDKKGAGMVRGIQVWKLRGVKHSSNIHHMNIGDEGIIIHPAELAEF